MAKNHIIATVSSIFGEAYIRSSTGKMRRLHSGDVIHEGETVVSSDGGRVMLRLADGREVSVVSGESARIDAEVGAPLKPDATDSAVTGGHVNLQKLVTAIGAKNDFSTLLDQQAPAAGVAAIASDGGHSFVDFMRIIENVDHVQTYAFNPTQRNGSLQEAPAGRPAPTLTAWLDPASDSGVKGDGITNDKTPTIRGFSEPGATVVLTVPSTGEVITVKAGSDGSWTATPLRELPDGPVILAVRSTGASGGVASTSVPLVIDSEAPNHGAAPTVEITEDANNDGIITQAEANGPVDLRISFDGSSVNVGDVVRIKEGGISIDHIITAADKAAGFVVASLPPQADGTLLNVTAVIVDTAGNSTAEGSDSALVETRLPNGGNAPSVEITEDANNDGYINNAESKGDIDIKIGFDSSKVNVGDVVLVTSNGVTHEVTVTAADKANGYVSTSVPPQADGTTLTVTAVVADSHGNKSEEGKDSAIIDTSVPNAGAAPTVEITEDKDNDGWINQAEAQGNADVKVSFDGSKVSVGDTVKITSGGVTHDVVITAADLANGSVTTSFAPQASGTTMTVSAVIVDVAGNSSAPGTDSAKVDTQVPNQDPNNPAASSAPVVEITEDANNDGFINRAEADGKANANVKVSFNRDLVDVGDTVKVTLEGGATKDVVITAADKDAGYVTTDFPMAASSETMTVTALIVDAAGNQSSEGKDSAKVDTSDLAGLVVTITEDTNNDGYINKAELQGTVGVEVKLPATAIAGDALTLTATDNTTQTITLTQAQIDAGKAVFELTAPADGTQMIVTAQIHDAAGNISNKAEDRAIIVTDDHPAPLVTISEDANNDGYINQSELNGEIDVSVSLGGTGAKAGDSLLVTVNGQPRIIVLSADNITSGSVAIPDVASPGEGNTLTITAQVKDVAGNLGAIGSDSAVIDTTPPNAGAAPTVEITEDANNDGWINKAEAQGNADVKVSFDGTKVAVGDTVKITSDGITNDVVITAADLANGYVTTSFAPQASGTTMTVSAVIVDVAGNSSAPGTDSAKVDTLPPNQDPNNPAASSAPVVEITEDANNDGFINKAEAIGNADVKVSFNSALVDVGDTVKITSGGVTKDVVITAADKTNGYVTTDFPMAANSTTMVATAIIVDAAGNQSAQGSDEAKVDTSDLAGLTVTITEDTNNDGYINKAELQGTVGVEVKLPATAIAGDALTLTATDNTTQTITLTQAQIDAGKAVFELTAPATGTQLVVTVQLHDAAGNESNTATDQALIITDGLGAPAVSITEDANNDGFINKAELNGDIGVSVSLNRTGAKAGDSLLVTVNGTTSSIVLTAADIAAGSVAIPGVANPGEGNTLTVTAQVKDAAGNLGATGSDSAVIDTTAFTGLAIAISEDANNDGFISKAELQGLVDVRVTLPAGAAVGDTLTITGSGNVDQTVILSAADLAAGHVDVSFNPTADNTDFKATASITDTAGNHAGPVEDTARLQLSAPGSPIVTITEDANNDGWINKAELNGPIDVSVTLPATAKAGDSLMVTVNGTAQTPIVLTAADIAKGSVAVPGIANPGEGQTLTVTAQVKDTAGNLSPEGSDSAIIDTTVPNGGVAPTVEITEDANNDGWINKAEAQGNADVKVSFDGTKVAVGDTVKITSGSVTNDVIITAADKTAGFVTTNFAPQADGTTMTVTAVIVDTAGNTSAPGSDSAKVDTQVPNQDPNNPSASSAPVVEITEDANNDGFINKAEASGNADVKVSFNSALVDVGDTVKITSGGVTKDVVITATDKANGYVTTDFPPLPSSSLMTVTAVIVDAAGNQSAQGSDEAKVDTSDLAGLTVTITEDANNDGYINKVELQGTVGVDVKLPATAIAGDALTLTATGNATQTITLTQAQIDAGKVTFELTAPATGTELIVTAQIHDPAGNESNVASDQAMIVTDALGAPTVTITEDANNDGFINKAELNGDIGVSVSLGGTGAKAGDSLLVTVNGKEQSIVLSAADIASGSVAIPGVANPGEGQTLTVTAQVKDVAGNLGATGSDSAVIDTTTFTGLAVAISEDANNDGFISKAELQGLIDVRVTLPAGAAVGDTLTITGSGNVDKTVILTAADLAAGHVDVSFNPTADNTDFKATASITDTAGNHAGPVEDTARLQLSAPGAPIVSIDEDTNNDGWINKAELNGPIDVSVTLPAMAKVGDSLMVTVNGTAQAPIVLTAADITKGSVAVPGVTNPGEGQTLTVTAQVKDAAGNLSPESSDSATIDTTPPNGGVAPTVEITEDANNDGWINKAEANGNADVKVSFDGTKVNVGDTVKITSGSVTNDVVITAADKTAGFVTANFLPQADGTTMTVSAVIVDTAGNSSAQGTDSAVIDTTAPNSGTTPTVEITEDANNDGFINKAEAQGNADVKVSFNGPQVNVGDTVKITSGGVTHDVIITATDKANGYVTTNFAPQADGSTMTATAVIVDTAGNTSAQGTDSAVIDTTTFTGLAIAISEDANNDGYIGKAELQGLIDVRVTLPAGAAVGDTLTVTGSGNVEQTFVLTKAQIDLGYIDTSFNPTADNTDFKATASITDTAGNHAGPVEDTARLQLSAPGAPIVTIDEDANNDGWINKAELNGPIDVSVTLPAMAKVGDSLLVKVNGTAQTPIVLTAADIAKGSVAVPGVTNPGEGQTLTVTAQVKDAAGNLSPESSDSAILDTTVPNGGVAPTVEITEDANNDGWINKAEANGNADVKVSFDGTKVAVGDIVKITSGSVTNDVLITAADKTAGFVTTSFPPQADGTTMTVTAVIVDAAGNSTAPGTDSAVIDTAVPNGGVAPTVEITEDANNDGYINKAEAQGNADVKVSFDGSKVAVGDTVKITSGGVTNDVVITAADKANGYVTTNFAPQADGVTMTVTALIVDTAGNKSTEGTDSAVIDTTVPNAAVAPVVEITEDANNDGYINKAEANGNADVKVSFDGSKVNVGDTVKITSGGITNDVVITAADKTAGFVTTSFLPQADGTTMTVTAVIVDAAGNSSAQGKDSAIIDTAVPNGGVAPTVEITEDANNDGYINKAEANGNADVKVSFDGSKVVVGDTVKITSGGITNDVVITATDKAAGFVSTSFAPQADGTTMTVTAVIVNVAGTSSAPGTDSAIIDTSVPNAAVAPVVEITEDANNDGWISKAEANGNADVKVSFDGSKVAVGDTVKITSNGLTHDVVITAADKTAGFVTTSFAPQADGSTMTVTAVIVDVAGNRSDQGTDSAVIDTAVPNAGAAPTVEITEDANNDGWINKAETIGNADVKVSFDGSKVNVGDTVKITSGSITNDVVITAADKAAGFVTTDFAPQADGSTMTVTAVIVDTAGNTSAQGSDSAVIDTSVPNAAVAPVVEITEDANNDGYINKAEANGNADVKVSFDGMMVAVGDTVKITSGGVTHDVIITAADKTNGFVTTNYPAQADGTTMTVTAVIVDKAGNSSAQGSDTAIIDIAVPNGAVAPTVEITEDANNDGYINKAEAIDNADVKVSFDGSKVNVGDTVKITSGGITNDVVITAADKTAGFVTTSFLPQADGTTMKVTAVIVDAAGNSSAQGTDSAVIDTSVPNDGVAPTVEITEDANNDGFINKAETIGNADVKVSFDGSKVAVGDKVLITSGAITNPVIITATDKANGYVTTSFAPQADGTTMTVMAKIVDTAGNSSAEASDSAVLDLAGPTLAAQTFSYAENSKAGDILATVLANDLHAVKTYRFAATGTQTSADGFYQIDDAGRLALTVAGAASMVNDFEKAPNTGSYAITAIDGVGNTSTATMTLNETDVVELPVITGLGLVGGDQTVYETNLPAGALPDSAALSKSGTFDVSAVSGLASLQIAGTSFTLAQLQGSASTPLSADTAYGTVTINGYTGTALSGTVSYRYTLRLGVNNLTQAGATDTSYIEPVSIKATDSVGVVSANSALNVKIVDDAPVAQNLTTNLSVHQLTNLIIVMDESNSTYINGGGTIASAERQGAIDLINAYDALGDVRVFYIGFSSTAQVIGSWVTASQAIALVTGRVFMRQETNYVAAVDAVGDINVIGVGNNAFTASGYFTEASDGDHSPQNVGYFLTDGVPQLTGGVATMTAAQQATWEKWLTANKLTFNAVGFSTADTTNLQPLAYNGATGSDLAPVLTDITHLSSTLIGLMDPHAATAGIVSGAITADGATVAQLVINNTTFNFDAPTHTVTTTGSGVLGYSFNNTTDTLTIKTADGGTMVVGMHGGSYAFTPNATMTGTITENMNYTVADGDGDKSSATMSLVITRDGGYTSFGTALVGTTAADNITGSANGESLIGLQGNDTLLGGGGDDILVGGVGNDTLTGGIGSDTFKWMLNDAIKTTPATDTITDFDVASKAAGGDVLDLRDLLVGESHTGTNVGNLASYLHFTTSGGNTTIAVNATATGSPEQTIILQGVNLVGSLGSDAAIIQDLLTKGKLITD